MGWSSENINYWLKREPDRTVKIRKITPLNLPFGIYTELGWIESYVQAENDRICLFQLESGARAVLANHGRSDELDLIFLAYTNLLRRLGG